MQQRIRKVRDSSRKSESDISMSLAIRVLSALDCPRSTTVLLLMQYEEWEQLVNLTFEPTNYLDVASAADAYQATVLLQKASHLPLKVDRTEVAVRKFFEAELTCEQTNRRLIAFRNNPSMGSALIRSVFHTAARYISNVLGDVNPDLLLEGSGFGPGVSSSVKGSRVGTYYKASGIPDVTPPLSVLGCHYLNASHPLPSAVLQSDGPASLLPSSMRLVKGNTVAFVPKNAKTDRSIAVEPHVNIFVQKGIGSYIRRRLKTVGVNLNDQGRNQELAQYGSKTGSLATVDLAAASDTISIELVRELLPESWFKLIDMTRSHYGYVNKSWIRYQKISSMGNGFTFELESLIFWALSRAVTDLVLGGGTVSVYGDDIIIRQEVFEPFIEVFTFAGFSTNKEKSFATGPFRESCGADFFLGVPIRPFFIRGPILSTTDRFSIHNRIFHYALQRNLGFGRDPRFQEILSWIRGGSKYLVPPCLGDVGYASSFEEASPHRAKHGVEGWVVRGLVQVPLKARMTEYWASLYSSMLLMVSPKDNPGILPPQEFIDRMIPEVLTTGGFSPLRNRTKDRRIPILVREWATEAPFKIYYL